MDCTRTITQCTSLHASTRVFQIGVWGISLSGGGWAILLEGFNLYHDGNLRNYFDHSNLSKGQKHYSVNIEH